MNYADYGVEPRPAFVISERATNPFSVGQKVATKSTLSWLGADIPGGLVGTVTRTNGLTVSVTLADNTHLTTNFMNMVEAV